MSLECAICGEKHALTLESWANMPGMLFDEVPFPEAVKHFIDETGLDLNYGVCIDCFVK